MSFLDEDHRKKPLPHEIGQDLSALSVDELDLRIEQLRAEIAQIEAEKIRKASGRAVAESLFRPPTE
jgi:uncharacterized small protein (DUF1192 family)